MQSNLFIQKEPDNCKYFIIMQTLFATICCVIIGYNYLKIKANKKIVIKFQMQVTNAIQRLILELIFSQDNIQNYKRYLENNGFQFIKEQLQIQQVINDLLYYIIHQCTIIYNIIIVSKNVGGKKVKPKANAVVVEALLKT
ncbi:Hypothetical_protein [Hexamita inflata]|uniref:Hypothetical_protein n=1 Tax=Hexamita inflata TaxID=28002 RepID=A0ABP1ILB3_9EUKA